MWWKVRKQESIIQVHLPLTNIVVQWHSFCNIVLQMHIVEWLADALAKISHCMYVTVTLTAFIHNDLYGVWKPRYCLVSDNMP